MSKPKLYLAGKMAGLTFHEMTQWRNEAKNTLKEDFNIIDPCEHFVPNTEKIYTDSEAKEFDLFVVKNSDIVLVNFKYPDSIGTAIELHMAHDEWRIPVIAYGGNIENVHPWMRLSITKYCETFDDAVEYIFKHYFKNL